MALNSRDLNQGRVGAAEGFHGMIGTSLAMRGVFEELQKYASCDAPILLTGESGTGKELAARAITEIMGKSASLVVVNAATLAGDLARSELFGHAKGAFTGAVRDRKGLIARADGGVLFLDEVAELDAPVQAQLLRVLDSQPYLPVGGSKERTSRFRLISATNRDLRAMVAAERFRSDLIHRIKGVTIELPPLRDRPGDLQILIDHFLGPIHRFFDAQDRALEIADDAYDLLLSYPWPGNVRELASIMDVVGSQLLAEEVSRITAWHVERHLQPWTEGVEPMDGERKSLDEMKEELERREIRRALARSSTIQEAAKSLGIGESTLYRKKKELGLMNERDGKLAEPEKEPAGPFDQGDPSSLAG